MFNVVHQKQPKTAAVSEDGVTIGPEFVAFSSIQKVLVNVPKKDKFIVKLVLKDKDYSLSFPTLTLRQEFNLSLQKHIANPPDNRQKVLAADPALRQLHADLVINGSLLSEDEFWVGREGLLEIYSPAEPPVLLKPTDKVTLTPEIIHSIFTLYPSVLKAYQDLVPTTLKETEFWSRYFSSKYLNPSSTLLDSYFDEEFKVKLQPEFRPDATMRPGSVAQAIPLVRKYNVTSQMSLAQAHKKTKLADASTTPKNLVISNANFYQPVAQDAEMEDAPVATLPAGFRMSHLTFESLSCKLLNFDSAKPHASHQVAIPNTIELKHIVMCSQELLRHFWSSHGDRRIKIQESLKQMKIKIVAFERQYSGHVLLYIRAAITSSTNAIDAALKSQT